MLHKEMHQRSPIKSIEDITLITDLLHERIKSNEQISFSETHIQKFIKQEEQQTRRNIYQKKPNGIRAKSADHLRTAPSIVSSSSSSNSRSTSIVFDEHLRITSKNEKDGLTTLNNRFASYLEKIKNLADKNIQLHHQIDSIHQKYINHDEEDESIDPEDPPSAQSELKNLRRQMNVELRQLISVQIRLQRADYDKKFYRNNLQLFSTFEQNQILRQQLDANLYELDLLKEQYERQTEDLQSSKRDYNEYITKLNEYTIEYNNIIYERMKVENYLYTLKEQLAFEHEYKHRCREEFASLEKIQHDSNNHFNKAEFENIVEKIRRDYRKYHEVQLAELDVLYSKKLESIQHNFQKVNTKEESSSSGELKELVQQNHSLEQKLKLLEDNLYQISEQNQQQYELVNQEYNQLENQFLEFESLIEYSRTNTVHLTSQINTYRCLLINVVSSSQRKTKSSLSIQQIHGFTVHFEKGTIWVRI